MSTEEIRSQIEAEVRRRLDTHFAELRSDFERLRAESDRRWDTLLARLAERPAELVPAGLIPEPEPALAPAATAPERPPELDYSEARKLIRLIEGAANQVETLKYFLEACIQKADRVVLLVAKGDAFGVWKSDGFSDEEEVRLRSVTVAAADHPPVAAALQGTPVALPADTAVARALGATDAWNGILIPVIVREKISALLYADKRREDSPYDPDALCLFSFAVGVCIDRLATRKLHPAPALKNSQRWEAEAPPAAAAPAEEAPTSDFRTQMFPALDVARSAETRSAIPAAVEPAPAPAPPPPAEERRTIRPEPDASGVRGRQFQPAPGVSPGGAGILRGPFAAQSADPHDEARKVARLLVADIKLYNEAAIEEGKKHNDIYARLKDDIDRSRQTYNERVPESVRQGSDYFHDELIRALAGGRAEALGV